MLEPGTRLGAYEIAAPIGAGGMGEVYRARDTALGRTVAIKTLPDAFLSDPERIARFEREAQLLAAVNHPRIAAIYGLERIGGLSTRYVAGTTGLGLDLRGYDVSADGKRFLVVKEPPPDPSETQHEAGIVVAADWTRELNGRGARR